MALVEKLWPLRQARLAAGRYGKFGEEERLLLQLNRLYERYTAKYLGEGRDWTLDPVPMRTLAEYRVLPHGGLESLSGDGEDYTPLWAQMTALLPQGAFADFTRLIIFTDGPGGTLAYVAARDAAGSRWEIAVDPADAQDEGWFTETVLHEYCHYLTLNQDQVKYTQRQTGDTYNEPGMVSLPGSYLDDFVQAFWTGYLDDRLANPTSYHFFLRHEADFITDYAATDPAEDIAESFTYFVLYDPQEGEEVWVDKLAFFYDYPELARLRGEIRACLEDGAGLKGDEGDAPD